MVLVPITSAIVIGVGIYFIVDNVHKSIIKYNFDLNSVKNLPNNVYNEEVPEVTPEQVKEILIAQFDTNQRYGIDTSKTFNVNIIAASNSIL